MCIRDRPYTLPVYHEYSSVAIPSIVPSSVGQHVVILNSKYGVPSLIYDIFLVFTKTSETTFRLPVSVLLILLDYLCSQIFSLYIVLYVLEKISDSRLFCWLTCYILIKYKVLLILGTTASFISSQQAGFEKPVRPGLTRH